MGAAAWFSVHTAVPANENYIPQVGKSPSQTHNHTAPSHPLHPTLCHLQNHTVTTSWWAVLLASLPSWTTKRQHPPTHRPCLFMSAYQHPTRILSCLLITLWKSRLIQMSRPITCELSRGDLSPYLAVINTSWRIMHIWIMWNTSQMWNHWTLLKRSVGTMACSNHRCIKITSFMTVLGQSATVWRLRLW